MKSFLLIIAAVFALAACNNGNKKSAESASCCAEAKVEKKSACSGCEHESVCSSGDAKAQVATEAEAVTVFYYHGSRKCKTCKAVGEVAKTTVEKHFGGNAKVVFADVNTEDEASKALIQKYNMSGSGLAVLRNGEYENMTVYAFSQALNHPEKLEGKLKEAIEQGL